MKKYPKKHVIFDMDGTLTESKQGISKIMCSALQRLVDKGIDIVVISGADTDQMFKQLKGAPQEIIHMPQCGNVNKYWKNELTNFQKDQIYRHIYTLKSAFEGMFLRVNHDDLITDRGSQITFSFKGHNAHRDVKKRFDPNGMLRMTILSEFPFESDYTTVKIGGTTSLDYTLISGTKGGNLKRLMRKLRWNKKNCLYIGDALFKNGNDSTIIGIMPYAQVKNTGDTIELINKIAIGWVGNYEEEKKV